MILETNWILEMIYSFEKVKMIKNGFPCDIRNGAITIGQMSKAQMPSDIKFLPFPCCYYIQLVTNISLHTGFKKLHVTGKFEMY